MNTKAAAAAVTGARHLRVGRNGQDAARAWTGAGGGVAVVCDGCSAGASSEVGARLGAGLVVAAIADELARATPLAALWDVVRTRVALELARTAAALPGALEDVVEQHFLFTTVAVAWRGDEVSVWALGDGAYALGHRVTVLGPFAGNQPPYLGYDLLGRALPAHVEHASADCGAALVATDGVAEIGLAPFLDTTPWTAHPDALRRRLALLARPSERIDWDARRIDRVPAVMQDDGAIALLRWAP